ncbi:MAG: glycosyltransferase family 39 protein [Lentisphaerae bacterium]|nr:glycosyltransferase family 39 protein [Lentisphaerota bacterium]
MNESGFLKNINRHFSIYVYVFALVSYGIILFQAVNENLFSMPTAGTDQLSMLNTAVGIYRGHWPLEEPYLYSSAYTLFLTFLIFLSQGNLLIIRLLQAALCALIPVMIYKTGGKIGLSREASQLSALIYCFYGAAALISLDFLREAPLALCFVMFAYCLVSAVLSKKNIFYVAAGIFAGLTVLGRENFIPIVILGPLAILFFKPIRRRVKIRQVIYCSAVFFGVLLPVLLFNYLNFNSFSLGPGHVKNVLGAYHGNSAAENLTVAVLSILKNIPVQTYKFASSYEIPNSLSFYAYRDMLPILRIFIVPFNLMVGLALLGIYYYRGNKGILLMAILSLLYMFSMIFVEMFYRFRISAIPLISILAGAGLYAVIHDKIRKRQIFLTALLVCFFLFTYADPEKLRLPHEKITVAETLIYNGRYEKAQNYLEKMERNSIKCDPQWMELINELEKNQQQERAQDIRMRFNEIVKQRE